MTEKTFTVKDGKTVWQLYKESRAFTIQLKDLSEALDGMWIKVMPTSAHEASIGSRMEGIEGSEAQSHEAFKMWIMDWNLVGADGVTPLPLPNDGDEWYSVVPLEVQVYIAKKVNEVDEERLQVPQSSASKS